MKICLFTFYFSPDLSAGSFRSAALVESLTKKMNPKDSLVVITTSPNRYNSYIVRSKFLTIKNKLKIYRIKLPKHSNSMLSQSLIFIIYFLKAIWLCTKEKPDLLIGTSGRFMTALLTWISSILIKKPYLIDLRDIFSESISDIFSKKNKLIGKILNKFFSYLDKCVLNKAALVNVVSMGFPKYFEKKGIDTSRWVFYPNGVDNIFLNQAFDRPNQTNSKKLITYAGNIGYAQALEKIIPFVAKNLNENFDFLIIGDGSTRDKLVSAIKKNNIKNVKIVKPMNRKLLLDYYRKSDILFLHLDDTPAFMRVLPSKLFEYAAMGKPIVAGLQGYSRAFSKNHIPYAFIFEPGNVEECVSKITESINAIVTKREVDSFTENFSRKRLMNSFADDILNTISIK